MNWLKDISIALAVLLVLGRVMFTLTQTAAEFLRGLREDNKERNQHFEMLLGINQSIAQQTELTRNAIEQQTATLHPMLEAFKALERQVTHAESTLLRAVERRSASDGAVPASPEANPSPVDMAMDADLT